MCSEPVTFGGGMTIEKDGRVLVVVNFGREIALRLPALVVVLFGLFRVVLFRNFHCVVSGRSSVVSGRGQ